MKPSAVSFLKSQSFRVKWNAREMYKVTEYRGGCVYKTRSLGYIVCTPEYARELLTCTVSDSPLSTSISKQLL